MDGFRRKDSMLEVYLRELNMAVGVGNIDDNKSRKRRSTQRRADLKALAKGVNNMPLQMYMESVVGFFNND